jgi:hypothetical protein
MYGCLAHKPAKVELPRRRSISPELTSGTMAEQMMAPYSEIPTRIDPLSKMNSLGIVPSEQTPKSMVFIAEDIFYTPFLGKTL